MFIIYGRYNIYIPFSKKKTLISLKYKNKTEGFDGKVSAKGRFGREQLQVFHLVCKIGKGHLIFDIQVINAQAIINAKYYRL